MLDVELHHRARSRKCLWIEGCGINNVEASMIAVAQPPVSIAIDADGAFFHLCSDTVTQS